MGCSRPLLVFKGDRGAMTLSELVACVFCLGGIQGLMWRLCGWGAGSFVKSWQCGPSCYPDSSVSCLVGGGGGK